MCGIFGILTSDPRNLEGADALLDTLEHRGPDERGSWKGDSVFLGNRRLSIIDIAGGHQPMFSADRTRCIVYNGELYNFRDLRPLLEKKGYRFRTESDTEVVLYAYEEWGEKCLSRFNGMFAFAIWDDRGRTLFLARDRVGEKPLYYYSGGGNLIFGSEIKAIVRHPAVPRAVSAVGLANYLTFGHAVAPETMYRGIFKLPPGHFLRAAKGAVRVTQYWEVGDEPQLEPGASLSGAALEERVLTLLDDAVRRRMVADVPVGAFLSGGVDSSAVVALMCRHSPGRVKTFSLGFTIGGAYNELPDARLVAGALGTEHHELHVDHLDLVETLERLVYHYDEPFGDAANLPVYLISAFARRHVKVVLAGEGGDELFGGYRRYVADQVAGWYGRLPGFLIREVIPSAAGVIPRFRRLKRTLGTLPIRNPADRYAAWLTVVTPGLLEELCTGRVLEELHGHDPRGVYRHYYGKPLAVPGGLDHLNRLLYVDFKTWLPDTYMEKVDKATMACSLEGRLPLLDHRLVELAFQIPSSLKIRGLSTKRILKRAVRTLLPPEVLRKPKHGFSVPTDPWFRGPLKEFVFETLMDPRTRSRGYFKPEVVERLFRLHREGKEVLDTHLWLLLNFELWHRMYIDRRPVHPGAMGTEPS